MNKKTIQKLLTKFLIFVTVLFLFSASLVLLLNKWEVVINVNGDQTTLVEYKSNYEDQGAVAYKQGTILSFLREKIDVETKGTVDTSKLGSYKIEYTAEKDGLKASQERTVVVQDTTPPKITLTTNPDSYTLFNHPYEEEGYTAVDNFDGDLTDKVVREEKDGVITYKVIDSHGNKATVERKIVYDDRKGPVITLVGGNDITWIRGNEFADSYTAIDDLDGDITANTVVSGSVDVNTPGDYTLTYTCKDAHNNETTVQRIVHVQDLPANQIQAEDNKTIYLTFDDGPSAHTQRLLDVLAKYNIPATFFVTALQPDYIYMIQKEAQAGHVVGEHSYTHDYSNVYSSTDAFWNDFNAMNTIIYQQTGTYANLFRFPGGSSNTVSRNYTSGIMTALVRQAALKGYTYVDWNVSSGDAGGASTADEVFANVTTQVQNVSANNRPSVVLQHDTKGFSVDAVERIIIWGLQNGYHFSSLTSGSYTAHHGVAN